MKFINLSEGWCDCDGGIMLYWELDEITNPCKQWQWGKPESAHRPTFTKTDTYSTSKLHTDQHKIQTQQHFSTTKRVVLFVVVVIQSGLTYKETNKYGPIFCPLLIPSNKAACSSDGCNYLTSGEFDDANSENFQLVLGKMWISGHGMEKVGPLLKVR